MDAFGKIKTTIFVVFLSTALSRGSFGQTAGIDYYLAVFNAPPAETMVELGRVTSVQTPGTGGLPEIPGAGVVPEGGVEDYITPGAWLMPKEGQGAMDLSLGRIEYQIQSRTIFMSYTTEFSVRLTDSEAGPTTCSFSFRVDVEFGRASSAPIAVVASATANGRDSSEFAGGPGASPFRCQVAPISDRGPSMYIYSDSAHMP